MSREFGDNTLSVYVLNIPLHLTIREMWNIYGKKGNIVDVYIAKHTNKLGQMFAFCRYDGIDNCETLINSLNEVWIGRLHLHADIDRFDRKEGSKHIQTDLKRHDPYVSSPIDRGSANSQSYMNVVRGQSNEVKKDTDGVHMVESSSQLLSQEENDGLSLALIGCHKDFRSIVNSKVICKNEAGRQIFSWMMRIMRRIDQWEGIVMMKETILDEHEDKSVGDISVKENDEEQQIRKEERNDVEDIGKKVEDTIKVGKALGFNMEICQDMLAKMIADMGEQMKGVSDHWPILRKESVVDYGPTPFRFFHSWLDIERFHELKWNIVDVYIAKHKNKLGQMFAFCRYDGIDNCETLINLLNEVWIGRLHLHVNIGMFDRKEGSKPIQTDVKRHDPYVSSPIDRGSANSQSYMNVVRGQSNEVKKDTDGVHMVESSSQQLSQEENDGLSLALIGCHKDFRSITNSKVICRNEVGRHCNDERDNLDEHEDKSVGDISVKENDTEQQIRKKERNDVEDIGKKVNDSDPFELASLITKQGDYHNNKKGSSTPKYP
nr:RNA-directed DNA polymerase, eukaryota [Tanacetum cinerariifolium]